MDGRKAGYGALRTLREPRRQRRPALTGSPRPQKRPHRSPLGPGFFPVHGRTGYQRGTRPKPVGRLRKRLGWVFLLVLDSRHVGTAHSSAVTPTGIGTKIAFARRRSTSQVSKPYRNALGCPPLGCLFYPIWSCDGYGTCISTRCAAHVVLSCRPPKSRWHLTSPII